MSVPVVINKLPSFQKSLFNVLDDAIKEAARDTLVDARNTAPFDDGPLRSNSIVDKISPLRHRVSFWMEYARFQEFGGDETRRVRHYKTSGTGAHFLRNAGDKQTKKLKMTIKKHAVRARA